MKQVLLIIGKLKIGGAERVARDIGYYADKSKYRIHYLVFEEERGAYEIDLENEGCIIHHMPSPSDNQLVYFKNLIQLIKLYDINVIHSHTLFNSGWAMLAGKLCGVPIRISHSHTIKGPEKRGMIKNIYEHIMRWIIILLSTKYIGCGKSAGQWLFGKKVFDTHGKIIYNGIDLAEFYYDDNARQIIRKKYELQNKYVIGHVGHLLEVKNQQFLLSLMRDIIKVRKDVVLILLGDGPDKKMLENIIKKYDLSNNVIMTGNVNNVGEYMSAMDVFAFPSLYEGMPLAMIEAQTNGLPCVISNHIPDDIYLTDLISVLSLDEKKEKWIQVLLSSKRNESITYGDKMYNMGFATQVMLEKIYNLYEG